METSPGTFLLSYLICSYLLSKLVYINMNYLLESIFQTNLTSYLEAVLLTEVNIEMMFEWQVISINTQTKKDALPYPLEKCIRYQVKNKNLTVVSGSPRLVFGIEDTATNLNQAIVR